MSGKSIQYWRNRFESLNSRWTPAYRKEPMPSVPSDWYEFTTITELLCEYSAANRSSVFGVYGGSAWSRFWAGRWGTHHGNEVRETLELAEKLPPKKCSVASLISLLKTKLGNKPLKPDGDLSRILEVIKEKTGVALSNDATSHCSQKL